MPFIKALILSQLEDDV